MSEREYLVARIAKADSGGWPVGGALIAGPPGAAVGGAIGARKGRKGRAAAAAAGGSLVGSLAGGVPGVLMVRRGSASGAGVLRLGAMAGNMGGTYGGFKLATKQSKKKPAK